MKHTGTQPDISIIYEDAHLLIVDKPHDLLSQGDHTGDPDLLSLCREYLGREGNREPFVGLVHRLDRPASGLMMLGKTRQAASDLSRQMRERTLRKTYRTVVFGSPPSNGVLTHHLRKDRSRNVVTTAPPSDGNAKKAVLSFSREDENDGLSLLSVHLQTGRPHQIRVQFAAEGHGIWGDYKYASPEQPDGRTLALRSTELVLFHPGSGDELQFGSPLPSREPWSRFPG